MTMDGGDTGGKSFHEGRRAVATIGGGKVELARLSVGEVADTSGPASVCESVYVELGGGLVRTVHFTKEAC